MELTTKINDGRVELEVTLLYEYVPADPGVPYYRDRSGCAPTGAEVNVYQVILESVDFGDYSLLRTEIEAGWLDWLECEYAWNAVDFYSQEEKTLWFDMVENAEGRGND